MRYIPSSSVANRAAAWRHLRVKDARRERMVPFKRSIKEVVNSLHPFVLRSSAFAFSCVPLATVRVISTTRLFAGLLDDRGNAQIRPDFQTASSPTCLL